MQGDVRYARTKIFYELENNQKGNFFRIQFTLFCVNNYLFF